MSSAYNNKTVMITGGAGGLGFALVQKFLTEGANVVATDINDGLLESLPSRVDESQRSRLLAYKADSTDDVGVASLMTDIVARYGRLDVLINNAGVSDNMAPTGDATREIWDKNILVNLTGPFLTSQHAIKQFLKQEEVGGQRGVILNVISAAGLHGARAGVAYTASKHGVTGLTKATAAFYGPKGIRCMAIMPGPMMTEMAKDGHDTSKFHPEGLALTAASFNTVHGDPAKGGWNFGWSPLEQVAKTIVMLCSEGLGTINGALVPTDMGWTSA